MEVIEAEAAKLGAPLLAYGQQWHVWEEHGRLVFQDETGLLDLPMPALRGAHQVQNAGAALMALRSLGLDDTACEAAMLDVTWPARMQRLREGPLVTAAAQGEVWLDGGHNPAAGLAIAQVLKDLPKRPTHLICGMLNTKDVSGFMTPLTSHVASLTAVTIPGEAATLPAEVTAQAARDTGIKAESAADVLSAIKAITAVDAQARILICGSLYLAGHVLRENG
jgi:dihydrofolate synthase/folylpolyglutamate synthase